jgi:hypothetical protein
MVKHLLYEEREGDGPEQEDWWYVIADDDTGIINVLHEWSHKKPHMESHGGSGERSYEVDEFLNSDGPQEVKAELELFIAGGGRA